MIYKKKGNNLFRNTVRICWGAKYEAFEIIIPEFEGAIIFVPDQENSETRIEEGEEKDESESWI